MFKLSYQVHNWRKGKGETKLEKIFFQVQNGQ